MPKHRMQLIPCQNIEHNLLWRVNREIIAKINIPNLAYTNQHIDTKIPHGSRDHAIVPDTVKSMFNLDIESTDKADSIVNNVGI